MRINEMAETAYKNGAAKGFWDDHATGDLSPETICAKLALVHSEVSEATEDAREGKLVTVYTDAGKPIGFGSELADIIIRVGDLAGRMGIDLQKEIYDKMLYNATRPRMHGKKI